MLFHLVKAIHSQELGVNLFSLQAQIPECSQLWMKLFAFCEVRIELVLDQLLWPILMVHRQFLKQTPHKGLLDQLLRLILMVDLQVRKQTPHKGLLDQLLWPKLTVHRQVRKQTPHKGHLDQLQRIILMVQRQVHKQPLN